MTATSDWVYCRVVDRQTYLFPRPSFWVGQVEFSEYVADGQCRTELDESMRGFGLSPPSEPYARVVRARVILPGVAEADVDRVGAFHIDESIRLFHFSLLFAPDLRLTMLEPGYRFNVRAGVGSPRLPPHPAFSPFSQGRVMEMDDQATHPKHIINTLLSAPDQFGELSHGFRRASHWRELARSVADDSQAILLLWMAVECLCKTTVEVDVCAKLMAALGFPSGAQLQNVAPRTREELVALPDYRTWKGQLRAIADGLRTTRNNIVHAGFRHVELSDVLVGSQLTLGKAILGFGTRKLLEMALWALAGPQRTVAEMWSAYPECLSDGLVAVARTTLQIAAGGEPPVARR